MCEQIMVSIYLFKAVRKAYSLKKGFDEHTAQRHHVPNSFPDQLKGMWFCLKNGFLTGTQSSDDPDVYSHEGSGNQVVKFKNVFWMSTRKATKR